MNNDIGMEKKTNKYAQFLHCPTPISISNAPITAVAAETIGPGRFGAGS